MRERFLCLMLMLAWAPASAAADADWPQFRGPTGQGHAAASELPLHWSESESISWKVPIPGRGWSSPVVQDGVIWITTATGEGQSLRALAIDVADGKLLHDLEVFRPAEPLAINPKNSYASPTAVLEPGRAYVCFGAMGAAAIDSQSGRIVWKNTDLVIDHKEGPGSSPILHGERIFLNCDGMDQQYVVALDKHTGRVLWRTDRSGANAPNPDQRKAYCTPLVIEADGEPQLVSPGADQVVAYDPATGEELWMVRYKGYSNVPRPLFADGRLFIATGFTKGQLWAIQPGGRGDLSSSNVLWREVQQVPNIPSPIYAAGCVFMVSDRGVATCLDAKTGQLQWRERLGGNYCASPILVGETIYFCNEAGETHVIRAARQFERLATSALDGALMASPAVAEGALILRTDTHLYRIDS